MRAYFSIPKRFQGYEPRSVTPLVVWKFLRQFQRRHRPYMVKLLACVRYVGRDEARRILCDQLQSVIETCRATGTQPQSIVVVPASSKGESSDVAHDMLKADERVAQSGVQFFKGNPLQLGQLLRTISSPVVVFVDDFAGTGKQFCDAHSAWNATMQLHNPVTYFVTCVMCSPAVHKIGSIGVIPSPGIEHRTVEMFKQACEEACGFDGYCALMSYAKEIHSKLPLGFDNMGTMILMYRNAPNNMPFLLRGTQGQRVWYGLFPRKDQLVAPTHI